jgi:hypothetical protein
MLKDTESTQVPNVDNTDPRSTSGKMPTALTTSQSSYKIKEQPHFKTLLGSILFVTISIAHPNSAERLQIRSVIFTATSKYGAVALTPNVEYLNASPTVEATSSSRSTMTLGQLADHRQQFAACIRPSQHRHRIH